MELKRVALQGELWKWNIVFAYLKSDAQQYKTDELCAHILIF